MIGESPSELVPSMAEMKTLLPHVRAGQPEIIRRWLRGAIYHHAVAPAGLGLKKWEALDLALSDLVSNIKVRVEVA